jgi:hypothetical protein
VSVYIVTNACAPSVMHRMAASETCGVMAVQV